MNAFKAFGTRQMYRYQEGKGLEGNESWQAVLTHDANAWTVRRVCLGMTQDGGEQRLLERGRASDISTLRHGQALRADQRLGK